MRTAAVISSLIVLGIIVWILFGGEQDSLDPEVSEGPFRTAGQGDAGPAGEPTTGLRRGPEADLPDVIRTKPFTPPKKPVIVRDGLRLRIVEAASGKPVPGIVVGFLDMEAQGPASILGGEHGLLDLEGHIDRLGLKFQADQNGEVIVPRAKKRTMVCAQTETLFGMTTIRPTGPEPAILKLESVGSGSIQVLGPDGTPRAGVPVSIGLEIGGVATMIVWRGVTKGQEGMVRLRNLNVAMRLFDPDGMSIAKTPLRVLLGIPVEKSPEVLLEDHKFPKDSIQLRLPETGRVVVTVTQPADRDLALKLHRGLTPFMGMSGMESAFAAELIRTRTENGQAAFPYVGLGLSLTLDVEDPAGRLASRQVSVVGPRAPGEDVHVEVALVTPSAAITGLVLDEAGRPWANKTLTVLATPLTQKFAFIDQGVRFQTDDKGRFRMALEHGDAEIDASGPFIVSTRHDQGTTTAEIEYRGRIEIGGPFPPGDSDIGEIILKELPVAVTGTVTDEQKRPVHNAIVTMTSDEPSQPDVDSPQLGPMDEPTAYSGADGSFVIRAPMRRGSITVTCSRSGYCSPEGHREASKSARVGDRGVVLVLTQAGAIAGSVLLDPGISPDAVSVQTGGGTGVVTPDREGRFEIRGLKPGTIEVRVMADARQPGEALTVAVSDNPADTVADAPGMLAKITGVKVTAGQTNKDPRLQGIDLRGRLVLFRLRVVDPDGKPVKGVSVTGQKASEGLIPPNSHTSEGGDITLTAPGPSLLVELSQTGYRNASLTLSPGDNRITLERGYLVRLTLAPGTNPPGGRYMLVATLTPESGKGPAISPGYGGQADLKTRFFTDAWMAQLAPPAPGRYKLQLRIFGGLTLGADMHHAPIENPEPAVIEVRPGESLTEVTIRIAPAELEKALKKK